MTPLPHPTNDPWNHHGYSGASPEVSREIAAFAALPHREVWMIAYAFLLGPPSALVMFITGWVYGANSYTDHVHGVAASAAPVLAIAALLSTGGAIIGGSGGLVIGAIVASRAGGDHRRSRHLGYPSPR